MWVLLELQFWVCLFGGWIRLPRRGDDEPASAAGRGFEQCP